MSGGKGAATASDEIRFDQVDIVANVTKVERRTEALTTEMEQRKGMPSEQVVLSLNSTISILIAVSFFVSRTIV